MPEDRVGDVLSSIIKRSTQYRVADVYKLRRQVVEVAVEIESDARSHPVSKTASRALASTRTE
jgi:plastocyanin domain-containing protein